MIKLNADYITTVKTMLGLSVADIVTTDTLFVSRVDIDLASGTLYATIQRGTGTPFVPNLDPVQLTLNSDGSFVSTDGMWNGNIGPAAGAIIASLKAQFDEFILASSKVTGTAF
jgi:hypothetical protein